VVYKQQLESARAVLVGAKAGTKFANISAPISGTVIKLDAQPGQEVKSGQAVATIVDLEALRIEGRLTDEQAGIVKAGMPAVVKFKDLANEAFDGQVQGVRTLPDEGDVDRVANITFKNRQGMVKPGMVVDSIGVQTDKVTDVLAVPVQAVDKDEKGLPYVQVQVGQKWERRVVETGVSDGDYVQIKSGVKPDDTVLVTP
jgi:RND family efflux transporter MFP subunit